MGDLEYHDKRVAEAREEGKQQAIEEAKQQAPPESDKSGNGVFLFLIFLSLLIFSPKLGEVISSAPVSSNTPSSVTQTVPPSSASLSDYLGQGTVFRQYTDAEGNVYIWHNCTSADNVNRQGFYNAQTKEFILLDIKLDSAGSACQWTVFQYSGGTISVLASGNDPADGYSSANCRSALLTQLAAHGFDSAVSDPSAGAVISAEDAHAIMGV